LGRIDDQVKIRGFRIELGEIEASLCAHPNVQECVVIVREDTPNDRRLEAYFVADSNELTHSGLRHFLQKKLPEYMIPSAFMRLDSLPLTPNGKVDRKALPTPGKTRPELQEAFVSPRNEVEETLAEIWSQVLDIQPVGIHDNFFNLGGHSIMATQIIARAHSKMGVELPLISIFESPTIAEMGKTVLKTMASQIDSRELENLWDDKS
jgi:acyl carrier protein